MLKFCASCVFPIGILGQVWYFIVSIPDLCTLTYFVMVTKHTMKIFDCMGELEIGQAGYFLIRSCTYYCLFVSMFLYIILCVKVRKTTRIRNRCNQVPHLSQDTKWESNKITINIANKSQEVSRSQSSMTNTRHK